MHPKYLLLIASASLSLMSAAPSNAQSVGAVELDDKVISVSGHGHHRSFPCNGRKLEVMGSAHVITTTGECSHVEVSGSDNSVKVTIAPKGTLEVSGSQNTVQWKASTKIKQDISGVDNKITRVQ